MHNSIPHSDYGGVHPELAARITAAKAAIGDFERESGTYINEGQAYRPDWSAWSFRLHREVKDLVESLERLVAYRPSGDAAAKYRKIYQPPARQFTETVDPAELAAWCGGTLRTQLGSDDKYIAMPTRKGDQRAYLTDWIVQGEGDEFYPVEAPVWENTYERVDES